MNIGLFFGSFNPIHIGHLIIANTMVEQSAIGQVWFVVSPQNPFKKSKSLLHEFDRLDMVRAAVHDDFRFRVTDIEFGMPRPSYTIDTLAYLSEKHPGHAFKLIIGEDNLKHFPKWKNHQKIIDHYGLYVYPRPGSEGNPLAGHENLTFVSAPLLDISATFIRESVKAGHAIKYLVPAPVEEMIVTKKFYQ